MQKIMKSFYKSSLITSVVLLLIGVLLLFKSDDTIVALSYILGCILLVLGIIAIVNFFRKSSIDSFNDLNIVYGIVTIILGVLIITNPTVIATFIPIVVGLGIVISSSIKLAYSIELKNDNDDLWKSTLVMAAISALCGVLILFNPFKASVLVFKIIGVFIIIYSILDIISIFQIKKDLKQVFDNGEKLEVHTVEAEVVEEVSGTEEEKSKKKRATSTKKKTTQKNKTKKEKK